MRILFSRKIFSLWTYLCLWVWCCRDNYSVGESCVIQAQIVSSSFNEFVAGKSVQQSLIWFLANSERYQDQTCSQLCVGISHFLYKRFCIWFARIGYLTNCWERSLLMVECRNKIFFIRFSNNIFVFTLKLLESHSSNVLYLLKTSHRRVLICFYIFMKKEDLKILWPIKNRRLPSKLDNWQLVHALQVTFNATFQV